MSDCWTPRGDSSSVSCVAVAGNAIACYLSDEWVPDGIQDCPRYGPPPYWGEAGVPPEGTAAERNFSFGFSTGFN
jgi:hypothetical protein